jgi:uncharacterized membrane protein YhaH (DUF805 family)
LGKTPTGYAKTIVAVLPGLLCIFAIFSFFVPNKDPASLFVLDVSQILAPLIAAFFCMLVARRWHDPRGRRSWSLIGIAQLVWALAQSVWSYYELVLGIEVPTPSFADSLWVLYYPILFVGLLLQLPQERRRFAHTNAMLDAVVFTLGLSGLLYQFILAPQLEQAESRIVAARRG